jgi:hypothetical protein
MGDYRALPEAIWLCPVDHPEFYVRDEDTREPHVCPQDGCRETMVRYARDSAGADRLPALRTEADLMDVIERAWREASLEWHEELGVALVRALEDEDDAITAVQTVRKFCVPSIAVSAEREQIVKLVERAAEDALDDRVAAALDMVAARIRQRGEPS